MECRACQHSNGPTTAACERCGGLLAPSCIACGEAVSAPGALCPGCQTDKVAPVEADELFATGPDPALAITGEPYDLRPAFTGRRPSLDRILAAFDATREQPRLGFVVVVGEPGMGKSRLLREAVDGIRGRASDARVLMGAADGHGGGYTAFVRLLESRLGIAPGDAPADQRAKISDGVSEALPAARVTEVAHLVAQLMRLPFPDSPVIGPLVGAPQQLETRTFLALRRLLAADAARGPLVLCLENLELCGPETVNLLHYLVAGLESAPVLFIVTARASLYQRHPSFGAGEIAPVRIDLGPLADDEAIELLRALCRPLDAVPERLIQHAKKLRGLPRALYELVRYLLEADVIARNGGAGWQIDRGKLAMTLLPDDHESLLAARLAVLPASERDLLQKAAIIGETFWLDAVVALARASALDRLDPDGPTLAEIARTGDATRTTVARALAKLVEREWLVDVAESSVPGEREYQFAYPPLWVTAYASVDDEQRRPGHRVTAQWLELLPEGRAPLAQEDVGRHLELAGDVSGAAARYRRAADDARHNFLNQRAIALYTRALACLGDADQAARIHLWHDLGSVYELKGDFAAALGAFERMLRLSWVAAARTKAAVAFNKLGRVWRRKGDLKRALKYLSRGMDLFEQARDARGIAGSLDDIGRVLYLLGRYDEAHDKVTQALSQRSADGDDRSIAQSLSTLGNIQNQRGRFAEARTCHAEALELRRRIGDRAGVIGSLNNLAVLAFESGDSDGARRGWEQALHEAEQIGALPLQATALANLGELALSERRYEEARRRLDDSLSVGEDIDDRRLQVEALRNLALLDCDTGDDGARRRAERALTLACEAGLRDAEGRCLLAMGHILGGQLFDADATDERDPEGTNGSAETYFRKGVAVLRDIGNDSELAKGLAQFGRYRIERGDVGGGKTLLTEARGIFGRLGMKQHDEVEGILRSL